MWGIFASISWFKYPSLILNSLKWPMLFHPIIIYNVNVISFFGSIILCNFKLISQKYAHYKSGAPQKSMATNKHDSYIPLQTHTTATLQKTQHTTTTTWIKSFQEYNTNVKCHKKIKHNLNNTYKSTDLGCNIALLSCITKESLGWKLNKNEYVFVDTTPTPW